MTPREPDRFEAKARELADKLFRAPAVDSELRDIAAALRAEHDDALERAAQWCSLDSTTFHTGFYFANGIRALASPAAAPAAETCPFGGCVNDASPSEPDAPALDRCPFEEKDCLEARVLLHQCAKALRGVLAHAEWLDKHLGRLPNTDEENARTVLAKLAARTSPGAAGEGKGT